MIVRIGNRKLRATGTGIHHANAIKYICYANILILLKHDEYAIEFVPMHHPNFANNYTKGHISIF